MRNPLANEEAAFRFLLGTIVYLAPIVVASWIATWLGVVVFVVMSGVAVAFLRRGEPAPAATSVDGRAAVEDTWRILVLADETLAGPRLQEVIVRLAEGVAEDVLLVCPIMPGGSFTENPAADDTPAAKARLQAAVAALRAAGVTARGELGDSDPAVALAAALEGFSADEIVISTHAAGDSPWLEQDIVAAAGVAFDGPVTHVVGD
jgi:hypothetical protein